MSKNSGKMIITAHYIQIGNRTIQLNNVAEVSTWVNNSYKSKKNGRIFFALTSFILGIYIYSSNVVEKSNIVAAVVFIIAAILFIAAFLVRPTYSIDLQTSAGKITALTTKDRDFSHKIVEQIQFAMTHRGFQGAINVDIDARDIKTNIQNVINSQNVNQAGGSMQSV